MSAVLTHVQGKLVALPVLEQYRLPPSRYLAHYDEKYARPLRKAFYFGVREGLGATWRKSRSKMIERRIESDQAVVIARVEHSGRRLIGITRDLGGDALFHPGLLFDAAEGTALESIAIPAAAAALLESYLPVPSCPFPEALPKAIEAANPGLRRVGGELFFASDDFQPGLPSNAAGSREESAARRNGTQAGKAQRDRHGQVFLLGCGAYVREQVLPHFRGSIAAAVDYKAELIRRHIAQPFPVHADAEPVLDEIASSREPLVIVSTYHSDHAPLAFRVLEANPSARVFVEKPVAVDAEDADALAARRLAGAWIDAGYNRRYAPMTRALRDALRAVPRPWVVQIAVQELKLPESHWYFWPNQGTRVTGNLCHWLDLLWHLVEREVTRISLLPTGDSTAVTLTFADGTLASITATDHGDSLSGVTERIEVRGGSTTVVLDDFRVLEVRERGSVRRTRRMRRDKGHAAMYADLRARWQQGGEPLYPADDFRGVGRLTHQATELLRQGGGLLRFARGDG